MAAHLGDAAPLWFAFKEGGCPAARTALIERYSYLVRISVGRVAPAAPESVDRGDMVAAGSVGLIQAVDRFDPGLGWKFETLAITRIKGAILDFLRGQDWAPRSLRRHVKTLDRAADAAGAAMTADDLSTATGLPLDTVLDARPAPGRAAPMQLSSARFRAGEGWEASYDEVLEGDAPDPYEVLLKKEQAECIRLSVARIPPRERVAVTLYFWDGKTCKEIGAVLGVSENRAYQILTRGVKRVGGMLGRGAPLFEGHGTERAPSPRVRSTSARASC